VNNSKEEQRLVETARRVLPGGSFGNVASEIVVREGSGGRVWDVSGNEYVDFLLGSGPMLLGHANQEVNAAVAEQLSHGSTFFANNERGIELAAEIVDALPCADQVRLACTGTEADAIAMRAARAYRKRSKILKFEGGYHGFSDYGLMSLWPSGKGNSSIGVPDSAGIPASVRNEMLIAPYNDVKAVQDLIHLHKDELAGVIVEPVQRLLMPQPGFLQGLRDITAEYDIPLIFDEVVTGFRIGYGGGQTHFGVTPDLCTLGKIVGGGYPLSAIAGKAEIMSHFDKSKVGAAEYMPQIGTLSGNPIAATAGLATLRILKRPGTYEKLAGIGNAIRTGLEKALQDAGIKAVITGFPAMFGVYFTAKRKLLNYRDTLDVNTKLANEFDRLLTERGILKSGKFYVSLAHDEKDIQHALRAFNEAAQIVAKQPNLA
jgi:glutamate-1-semialdehyde 2,1-aminomutase